MIPVSLFSFYVGVPVLIFFWDCLGFFFADSADGAGFHGAWGRGFALQGSLVLLFEKRLVDAVINKVPGEQFV